MRASDNMAIRDDETVFSNNESGAKGSDRTLVTTGVTSRCGEEPPNDCTYRIGIRIGRGSSFGSFGSPVCGADTLLFYENSYYARCNASDECSISGWLGTAYSDDQWPGERNEDQYYSVHMYLPGLGRTDCTPRPLLRGRRARIRFR